MSQEITKLKNKCDRLLQDALRAENMGATCELCPRPFTCHHHHVPKSRSNYLRYNEDNLVRICQGCHRQIHLGIPAVWNKLIEVRTESWSRGLERKGHIMKSWKVTELRELKEKYTQRLKEALEN